jgi:hypothetical protein
MKWFLSEMGRSTPEVLERVPGLASRFKGLKSPVALTFDRYDAMLHSF